VWLLITGSDFVFNSLYLIVIVIAKRQGASPATVGAMLSIIGGCGVAGAVIAPSLARRLSLRQSQTGLFVLGALLVPLLAAAPNPWTLGAIVGVTFAAAPTANAKLFPYQMRLTPDRLQGRVQSCTVLASQVGVPLGTFLAGFLLTQVGSNTTLLVNPRRRRRDRPHEPGDAACRRDSDQSRDSVAVEKLSTS
jgi:predicted MFS family arabinose efflux permease